MRAVDGCIKCGACIRVCPILRQEGADSFGGPRRLAIEGPRFDRELASLRGQLLQCTTCGRCEAACPSALPLPEALVRVRALVRRVDEMPEGQRKMIESVDRTGRAVAASVQEVLIPERGDLLYFPGCVAHGRLNGGVRAALALLRSTGRRPYTPRGWACCGSPLQKVGDEVRLEAVRSNNRKLFPSGSTIVTACPGCTAQLRKEYGLEAWHVIEYLHGCGGLDHDRYEPYAPRVRVALHRPCHLSRTVGPHTVDQAKDLLAEVPGVTLVEYDGEDECCGGGGGVASSRPDVALRMARRKVEAARGCGVDLLLAPCPFCVVNLRKAGGVEVSDLTEFLAGRLRLGQKP